MRANYRFTNLELKIVVNGTCETIDNNYHGSSNHKHKNIVEYKDATASINLNGSLEGTVEARELLNALKDVIREQGIKKRG